MVCLWERLPWNQFALGFCHGVAELVADEEDYALFDQRRAHGAEFWSSQPGYA